MTDLVKVAIIAATPATIAAVGSILTVVYSRRNTGHILEIHKSVNSRLDQWIAQTKKSSYAEGKLSAESNKPESSPEV